MSDKNRHTYEDIRHRESRGKDSVKTHHTSQHRQDVAKLGQQLQRARLEGRNSGVGSSSAIGSLERLNPSSYASNPRPASHQQYSRQKIAQYLYNRRREGFEKTRSRLPRFLFTTKHNTRSGNGSDAGRSSSSQFSQLGKGGSFPSVPGGPVPGIGSRGEKTMLLPTGIDTFQLSQSHPSYIHGIQIWLIGSNGTPMCLSPGQPRFDIMAAAIMLGFDIMDSKDWRARMKSHARSTFEYIEEVERLPLPPGRLNTSDEINKYCEDFVRRCRDSSPVAILNDLGCSYWARTLKADWSARGPFNAQMSATIEYNIQVIDRIDSAAAAYSNARANANEYKRRRDQERFEREERRAEHHLERFHNMMGRAGILVAHEMEHVFTSYLLKDPSAHTPPSVEYGGFGDGVLGESGRYMEGGVLGGHADMKLELSSDVERISVRTYHQVWQLDYSQIQSLLDRRWENLPYYDPEGDSYVGVSPPKRIPLENWTDSNRYEFILSGRQPRDVPLLRAKLREDIRRGLYGGWIYRLRCSDLRRYSKEPGTVIEVLASYQVVNA